MTRQQSKDNIFNNGGVDSRNSMASTTNKNQYFGVETGTFSQDLALKVSEEEKKSLISHHFDPHFEKGGTPMS